MARRYDKSYLWAGITLLLVAITYTFLSYFTPLAYDDWMFMSVWNEVNGNKPLSLSTLYDFWKEIRLYDNGRLANTVAPLSTLFSPWKEIFPYITGLFVSGIIYFTSRLAFYKEKVSAFYLSIVWLGVMFFLPWRNSLFVADYSLNYIWAAVFTLVFMVAIVGFERQGWTIGKFILALMLAIIAGGWHEGFALPTLCGFAILTIKKGFRFSVKWYLIGIFYAAVALAFLYCPGIIDRSQRQLGVPNIGQSYIKMAFDFLPVIFIAVIIALTSILPPLRKFLRAAWDNSWFVIGIGIVLGGTLLSLLFTHQPRSAFWPDLMAIVMLFIITGPIWIRLRKSRFSIYITLLSLTACMVPIVFAITWQYRLYMESETILDKMDISPSGTVYHDIIKGSDIPIYTLKMTNHPAWVTDFHYNSIREFNGKPYPAVLPSAFQPIPPETEWQPLEGNAGAFKTKDVIFIPEALYDKAMTMPVELSLKSGEETSAASLFLPFKTTEGYVMTYIVVYGISVDEIEGISL